MTGTRWNEWRYLVVDVEGNGAHPPDLDVLGRKLPGWHAYAVLDTLRVARALLPGLPWRTLGALVNYFDLANGLPEGLRPHRATYDALVTAKLLLALAVGKDGLPRSASELHELGGVSTAEPKTESQLGLF